MQKISAFIIFLLSISAAMAQIPAGYYSTATGSGYILKSNLHDIIDDHTDIGYSAVWNVYDESDIDPLDGKIWDIYSEVPNAEGALSDTNDPYNYTYSSDQCGNYSGENSCYNREHSFPKSWFSNAGIPHDDVHHLYPTDGYVNGQRGSFPYGEVGSATWTSQNGSKKGSARSGLGYSGTVFEPIDEFKGDLARTYFYMATRYEDVISGWSSPMLNGSTDQVFTDWALDMLLEWHNNDPVSQKEITRNDAIYGVQNNRNPFIDHPEFVNSIWGDCVTPVSGPSVLVFTDVSNTSVTLTFAAGDGDARLVLMKETGAVDFDPVDGNAYSADADFSEAPIVGTDTKVISASGTTSVTVTGLSAETTYFVEVFEYCSAGNLYFISSTATASVTTSEAPAVPSTYSYQYLYFNEIIISTPGVDYEVIELSGIPGQNLGDLSIITIDRFGEILTLLDLSEEVIPSDGFWLAANSEAGATTNEDFTMSAGLVNNTTTFLLLENFTGGTGDDLDTNNDGLFDTTPWDNIVDEFALLESNGENIYSGTSVGPDGSFLPSGAYRLSDGCGSWAMHTFDTPPDNATAGVSNGAGCWNIYVSGSWTGGTPDGTESTVVAGTLSESTTAETMVILENGTIALQSGGYLNVSGDLTNNGNITVESGGSLLTGSTITGSGTFTIDRNTTFDKTTGKYSFISSPVTEGSFDELGSLVFAYDETVPYDPSGNRGLDRYIAPAETDMIPGKGYTSAFTGKVSFVGTPNTGNIAVGISKTNHSASDASEEVHEGYNLVGNPYPSAIELNEFLSQNEGIIEGAIWLWDDNNEQGERGKSADFITINDLGAVSGGSRSADWNGYIGAMQGFFVQVLQTAGADNYNLNFTNAMRDLANNTDGNYFRQTHTTESVKLSLRDAGNSFYDETLIGFTEEATVKKDSKFDAMKLITNGSAIYSLLEESRLAIQGLPTGQNVSVPLGMILPSSDKEYILAVEEILNMDKEIYLKDHENGTLWDLTSGHYQFRTGIVNPDQRFSLIIADDASEPLVKTVVSEWEISRESIAVTGLESESVSIQMLDISGKLIASGEMSKEGSRHVFRIGLNDSNIYIIRITDQTEIHTIKALVR
ncbi:MAG: endonuclease [Cyclobacteriaceae bacterium]